MGVALLAGVWQPLGTSVLALTRGTVTYLSLSTRLICLRVVV